MINNIFSFFWYGNSKNKDMNEDRMIQEKIVKNYNLVLEELDNKFKTCVEIEKIGSNDLSLHSEYNAIPDVPVTSFYFIPPAPSTDHQVHKNPFKTDRDVYMKIVQEIIYTDKNFWNELILIFKKNGITDRADKGYDSNEIRKKISAHIDMIKNSKEKNMRHKLITEFFDFLVVNKNYLINNVVLAQQVKNKMIYFAKNNNVVFDWHFQKLFNYDISEELE